MEIVEELEPFLEEELALLEPSMKVVRQAHEEFQRAAKHVVELGLALRGRWLPSMDTTLWDMVVQADGKVYLRNHVAPDAAKTEEV